MTTFAFEFAALGFCSPTGSRYAVWLEGWDDGWVEIGDRRLATYTNLPPGRYTFRVRASDADGVWGEAAGRARRAPPARLADGGVPRAGRAADASALVAGAAWTARAASYRRELAGSKPAERWTPSAPASPATCTTRSARRSPRSPSSANSPGARHWDGSPAGTPPALLAPGETAEACRTARLRQIAET